MACFLVPVAEAVVVTTAAVLLAKKEAHAEVKFASGHAEASDGTAKTPFSKKLRWLASLLWGGSFLLLFEHVWHGEIVPWFPFLSAMSNPADTAEMLHEMATVGVAMALVITAVWVVMAVATSLLEKRAAAKAPQEG